MNIYGFEEAFSVMRYPAGETHVEQRLQIDDPSVIQVTKCRGFEDLGNVVTAAEILKHVEYKDITWFIPYFPFGRHDRRRHRSDGLELKIALDMVSHLRVVTLDPHSDVLGQLPHIPQSAVVQAMENRFGIFEPRCTVIIPDYGARKKTSTWVNKLPSVQATKLRNPTTGELESESVLIGGGDFHGNPCIIIDDICDGGATFINLADSLQIYDVGDLTLVVTHGLFTKGTDELLKRFKHIYSTGPHQNDKVLRHPLHELYDEGKII